MVMIQDWVMVMSVISIVGRSYWLIWIICCFTSLISVGIYLFTWFTFIVYKLTVLRKERSPARRLIINFSKRQKIGSFKIGLEEDLLGCICGGKQSPKDLFAQYNMKQYLIVLYCLWFVDMGRCDGLDFRLAHLLWMSVQWIYYIIIWLLVDFSILSHYLISYDSTPLWRCCYQNTR